MVKKSPANSIEVRESFDRMSVLFLGAIGFSFAVDAMSHFVSDDWALWMEIVRLVPIVVTVFMLLPATFHYASYLRFDDDFSFSSVGFDNAMLRKASHNAFKLTLLFIFGAEHLANGRLAHLPPAFFTQSILTVMLLCFAGLYIIFAQPFKRADEDGYGDG